MRKIDKKFCVYEHKFPNGKRYFGITSKLPEKRWQNGTGYTKDKQTVMHNAIQKYGWDNIEHNILFEGLSLNEAKEKEIFLIEKYKTNIHRYGNSFGYNMTDGGEGVSGRKMSKDAIEAIRKHKLGKTGYECPNSIPVICDGVEYPSIADFMDKNNITGNAKVCKWLSGKNGMPVEWFEKGLRYKNSSYITHPQKKPFKNKIFYDGVVYDSQNECAEFIGVAPSCLCLWMNGKSKLPKSMEGKELYYIDKENYEKIISERNLKTPVECLGVVYNTQRELAKHLGVDYRILNYWLTKASKIPEPYDSFNIKYIK